MKPILIAMLATAALAAPAGMWFAASFQRTAAIHYVCEQATKDLPEPQSTRIWWACHENLRRPWRS